MVCWWFLTSTIVLNFDNNGNPVGGAVTGGYFEGSNTYVLNLSMEFDFLVVRTSRFVILTLLEMIIGKCSSQIAELMFHTLVLVSITDQEVPVVQQTHTLIPQTMIPAPKISGSILA